MLSRLSPLIRTVPPLPPSMAARVLSRALPSIAALPSKLSSPPPPPRRFHVTASCLEAASLFGRRIFISNNGSCIAPRFGGKNGNAVVAARREYRKVRSRRVAAANKNKEKELELSVKICLEEQLPEDPEIMVLSQCSLAPGYYCSTSLVAYISRGCIYTGVFSKHFNLHSSAVFFICCVRVFHMQ